MIYVLLVGFMGLFLLYMYIEANRNCVVKEEIFFENLPKAFHGVRIFFISDLHFRIVSDKIIDEIQNNVDIVIIGGDLLEKKVPFHNVVENIKRLTSIAPTYFVWGNNDYEGDFRKLDSYLRDMGVTILDNKATVLELENEKISLLGVDNGKERVNLKEALSEASSGFKILASHSPSIMESVSVEDEIDLILTGHTHGGQIRLFGFGLSEKGSLKKVEDKWLLISNGYGTTGVHLRLGAPAQTHLITLSSKNIN